jgi:hypothetical protein
MLDINKDGKVDKIEFILSQRLMGYLSCFYFHLDDSWCIVYRIGPVVYGADIIETDALFSKHDINADGKMDFKAFRALIEDDLTKCA